MICIVIRILLVYSQDTVGTIITVRILLVLLLGYCGYRLIAFVCMYFDILSKIIC